MQISRRVDRASNRVLDALPGADRQRWFGGLTPAFVATRRVLFEPATAMEFVSFPLDAIISLLAPLENGVRVEVATVGDEGIVGLPPALGGSLAVSAICQVGGWVLRLEPRAFLEAVNGSLVFSGLVSDYLQRLLDQVAQTAACHRLHSDVQRLSRWLLMRQDRLEIDTFPVTHEFIAEMLGTRRAAVTVASRALQAAGLIGNRRGVMSIIDRRGLEATACECYGLITAELAGMRTADLRGHGTRPHPVAAERQNTASTALEMPSERESDSSGPAAGA